MKPKSFKLNILFAIFAVAVFCVSGGVMLFNGTNRIALAETNQTLTEEQAEQSKQEANGYWPEVAQAPGALDENGVQSLGSIDGPSKTIVITKPEELAWVASKIGGYSADGVTIPAGFSGWTIELQDDIPLGGKFWTPIGTGSIAFQGHFNGNGHRISGLTFDPNSSMPKALFGYCTGATIEDVVIANGVNVTNAILYNSTSSDNKTIVANCYSTGEESIAPSDNVTIIGHSIENDKGENQLTTAWQNKFYYEIALVYSGTTAPESLTGTLSGNGEIGEIAIPDNVATNQTIAKIEVFERRLSDSANTWEPISSYEMSNAGKTASYSGLLTISVASGQAKRGVEGLSSTGASSLPESPKIKYARQAAFRIVVTIETRKIKLATVGVDALSANSTYQEAESAHASPSATDVWSCVGNNFVTIKIGETSINFTDNKDDYFDWGNSITISASGYFVNGIAATFSSSWAGKWEQSSVLVTPSTDADTAFSLDLNVRIRNVFKVKIYDGVKQEASTKKLSTDTSTNDTYCWVNTDVNAPTNKTKLIFSKIKSYTDYGITSAYIVKDDYGTGNARYFFAKKQADNDTAESSADTLANTVNSINYENGVDISAIMPEQLNDETKFKCVYVLGVSTLTLKSSNDNIKLGVQCIDPYADDGAVGVDATTDGTYQFPNTYKVVVFNTIGNEVSTLVASGSVSNSIISPYSKAKIKDGEVGTGSYGTYVQAFDIYILGETKLEFGLDGLFQKVDFELKLGNGNNFDGLDWLKLDGDSITTNLGGHTLAIGDASNPQEYILTWKYKDSNSVLYRFLKATDADENVTLIISEETSTSIKFYLQLASGKTSPSENNAITLKFEEYTNTYNVQFSDDKAGDFSLNGNSYSVNGESILNVKGNIPTGVSFTYEFEYNSTWWKDNVISIKFNTTSINVGENNQFGGSINVSSTLDTTDNTRIITIVATGLNFLGNGAESEQSVYNVHIGLTRKYAEQRYNFNVVYEDITTSTTVNSSIVVYASKFEQLVAKKIDNGYQLGLRTWGKSAYGDPTYTLYNASGATVTNTVYAFEGAWKTYYVPTGFDAVNFSELRFKPEGIVFNIGYYCTESVDPILENTQCETFPGLVEQKDIDYYSFNKTYYIDSTVVDVYDYIAENATSPSYYNLVQTLMKEAIYAKEIQLKAHYTACEYKLNFYEGEDDLQPKVISVSVVQIKSGTLQGIIDANSLSFVKDDGHKFIGFKKGVPGETTGSVFGTETSLANLITSTHSNEQIDLTAQYESVLATINVYCVKESGEDKLLATFSLNVNEGASFVGWQAYLKNLTIKNDETNPSKTINAVLEEEYQLGKLIEHFYADDGESKVLLYTDGEGLYSGTTWIGLDAYTVGADYSWYPTEVTTYNIFAVPKARQIDVEFYDPQYYDGSIYTANVKWGKNEYSNINIATPSDDFATFLYWEAEDSEGNTFKFYSYGDSNNSQIKTNDASLTFYAYWEIPGRELEANGDGFTYDAEEHTVTVNLPQSDLLIRTGIYDHFSNYSTIKNGGSEIYKYGMANFVAEDRPNFDVGYVESGTDLPKISVKIRYVSHAGAYTVVLHTTDDKGNLLKNKAYGVPYISGLDNLTFTFDINIEKAQLYYDSAITKVYDGNTDVIQEVKGIYATDAGDLDFNAKYNSANAGEGIEITYTTNQEETLPAEFCYKMPTLTTGTIIPFTLNVDVTGEAGYTGNDIYVLNVAIDTAGNVNTTGSKITITEELKTALNKIAQAESGKTVTLQITASGFGEFNADNLAKSIKVNGADTTNYAINISGTFNVIAQEGTTIYNFKFVTDDSTDITSVYYGYENGAGENIVDESGNGFVVVRDENNLNDFDYFWIKAHSEWWVRNIKFVNENALEETITTPAAYVAMGDDGFELCFSTPTIGGTIFNVEIVFTQQVFVNFELGLYDGETAKFDLSSMYVKYGSTIDGSGITPERYALTFDGWMYADENGNFINFDSSVWNVRGDITLYATWKYNATVAVSGYDINATYNYETTYTFSSSVTSATGETNVAISNNQTFAWLSSKTAGGTYTKVANTNEIQLKNVAHSGFYKVEYALNNIKTYNNGTTPSIVVNITYSYQNTTNKYYGATITPADYTLIADINKEYDGTNTMVYLINGDDVDAGFADRDQIVGTSLTITYNGILINSVLSDITEPSQFNYNINALGKIVPRDVVVDIGTNTVDFNGEKHSVEISTVVVTSTITLKNIKVETTGYDVGEYAWPTGLTVVDFTPQLNGGSEGISIKCFNITLTGKVTIDTAVLTSMYTIECDYDKVYNGQTQNVTIALINKSTLVRTELDDEYFEVKHNGSTFVGAKDVSEHSVSIIINYPSFETYGQNGELDGTFVITQLTVFIEIIDGVTLAKTYDGNNVLSGLVQGTHFNLYLNNAKTEALYNACKTEIGNSVALTLASKNAGNCSIDSAYITNATIKDNYVVELISTSKTATITQKQLTLTISANKYYDGTGFVVEIANIVPTGLIRAEALTGNIKLIDVVNAGTYTLNATTTYENNLQIGGADTSNYAVTLAGHVVVKRAVIGVALTKEYEYTGALQTLKYTATRNSDNKDVAEILEVSKSNGVNVGTYDVEISIKTDYRNNHTFTDGSEVFVLNDQITITPKAVDLSFEQTQIFNNKVFRVYLADVTGLTNLLCSGHSFNKQYTEGSTTHTTKSFVETKGTYIWTYSGGLLDLTHINVYDSEGNDVTANYDLDTSGIKLIIKKTVLTSSDVKAVEKTYNGQIQNVEFDLFGIRVAISGAMSGSQDYFTGYDENGDPVYETITAEVYRKESSSTEVRCNFKYATSGTSTYATTYIIKLTSELFEPYTFEAKINPKHITKIDQVGDSYKNKNYFDRPFDNTQDVKQKITSSDIYDSDHVKLGGEYAAPYGNNIAITITGPHYIQGSLGDVEFELLKQSYVLDAISGVTGNITPVDVTFEYNGSVTYYYTGNAVTIPISDLAITGMPSGVTFGGTVNFTDIVNAGKYDLSAQTNYNGITVTVGTLAWYNISFVGSLPINKAQIEVRDVTNNVYTYDGTAKAVALTAKIYATSGNIDETTATSILSATYKLSSAGETVAPTNVGEYLIYPYIVDSGNNLTNYEYVGDTYLMANLTIEQRAITVSSNAQFVFDEYATNDVSYSFDDINKEITSGALVGVQSISGKFTISLADYANKTLYYYNTAPAELPEGLDALKLATISNVKVEGESGEDLTSNYAITYNLIVCTVDVVSGEGNNRATAIGTYIYNGEDQSDNILVYIEIGTAGETATETISTTQSGSNSEIVGFYPSFADAENETNQAPVQNAGTYYVRVLINGAPYYASFVINKKHISTYTTETGDAFGGTKVYDATSTIALKSNEICEIDKSSISFTGTYKNGTSAVTEAGSGYTIEIAINGDASNYTFTSILSNGVITKRPVTITGYNGGADTTYAGGTTITVDANTMLTANGMVSGHTLGGNVMVGVSNVGEYTISSGTNNITILSGASDVSSNYTITINSSLKVKITVAKVQVSWNKETSEYSYIYSAQSHLQSVLSKLTFVGIDGNNYTTGANLDITLKFTYKNSAGIEASGEFDQIVNAGSYELASGQASKSGNFEFSTGVASKEIIVGKKDAQVNLGTKQVRYVDYNESGYEILNSMLTNVCTEDIDAFTQGIYKIKEGTSYEAQQTYLAEDSEIEVDFIASITNNYNLTITGGLELLAEALTFTALEDVTFNGNNIVDALEIKYTNEEGEEKAITRSYTTNGQIKLVDDSSDLTIRDVGTYTITVEINTAEFDITLTVIPKHLTFNYSWDKTYDGTNEFNNGEAIVSDGIVDNAKLTIIATYVGFMASETPYAINFAVTGADAGNYTLANYTGKINKQDLVLSLGKFTLVYDEANNYQTEYNGATTLTGGTITQNTIKFVLNDNYVRATELAINSSNATFDLSGFEIKNGADVVTACYNITVTGTLTLSTKQFRVQISELSAQDRVFDGAEKQVSYTLEALSGTLTETDKSEINAGIRISYTIGGVSVNPINTGTYSVDVTYFGTNYVLAEVVGATELIITPFEYKLSDEGQTIKTFEKEYATATPTLVQQFSKTFDSGVTAQFTVTFERASLEEEIGTYDIVYGSINSSNFVFECTADDLADKFVIKQNTTNTIMVTINGARVLNGLVRYYGLENIGLYNITDLTYTAKIDGNDFASGITEGILAGTVTYNCGNVGLYNVKEYEITSPNFTKFIVNNDESGKLKIEKRTLVVVLSDYNKVYDGTNQFVDQIASYNFNTMSATQGTISEQQAQTLIEKIELSIAYENANAGSVGLTITLLSAANYNVSLEQTTGEIAKLKIDVVASDVAITYGNAVEYNYTVSVNEAHGVETNINFSQESLNAFVQISVENATYSNARYLNVGEYNFTIASINSNVEIVNKSSAKLTVNKKLVTVTFSDELVKEQDGTTIVNLEGITSAIDGVLSGDEVKVDSANYADANSGAVKEITITLGGADANNYSPNKTYGTINIRLITFNFTYYYEGCHAYIIGEEDLDLTTSFRSNRYSYYAVPALPTASYKNNGVVFKGWSLTQNGDLIDATAEISTYIDMNEREVTLFAIWETVKFAVTIEVVKYNPKTEVYDQYSTITKNVDYLTTLEILEPSFTFGDEEFIKPTIEHHAYIGYGKNNTNFVYTDATYTVGPENCTIYLMYMPETIYVTFDADGGIFVNKNINFAYESDSATIGIYYGLTIGEVVSNLGSYLQVNKTGYTCTGWNLSGSTMQPNEISEIAPNAEINLTAVYEANKYDLTLDANGGTFSGYDTSVWSEVTLGDASKITTKVAYDSPVPSLPEPTKNYYTFTKFVDALNKELTESTWTKTQALELKAVYVDNEFTLTIKTQNVKISLRATNGAGALVTLTDSNEVDNIYVYTVFTTYNVQITAEANAGYHNITFVDQTSSGTLDVNKYVIAGFTQNPEIQVGAEAIENTITIKTNNDAMGYITTTFEGNTYTSNAQGSFMAKTGTSPQFKAEANEGYRFVGWAKSGTGELQEDANDSTLAILSGFTGNVTITAKFEALDINIAINNDSAKGSYVYNAKTYQEDIQITAKAGTSVQVVVTATVGFVLDADNTIFTRADGKTSNANVGITTSDNKCYITLSGFTSDGTLTLAYEEQQFIIKTGYARYDEVSGAVVPTETIGNIININGTDHNTNQAFTGVYGLIVELKPVYQDTGYEFDRFVCKNANGEFVTMVGSFNSATQTLSFTLNADFEVYVVYKKSTFTVTYIIDGETHGNIGKYVNNNNDFVAVKTLSERVMFGYQSTPVVAQTIDAYRDFKGWTKDGVTITTNTTLDAQTIEGNITFVAVFEGQEKTFDIVIHGVEGRAIITDIANAEGVITNTSGFTVAGAVHNEAENTIVISVKYSVGNSISFKLNIPEFYQNYLNYERTDNFEFSISNVHPTLYDESKPLDVWLVLRYYSVKILTEGNYESAMTITKANDCASLGVNSTIGLNGEIFIEYGKKLSLNYAVKTGYTFMGQDIEVFTFNSNNATIAEVTEDIQVKFNFVKTKYKVTFNTNYPTSYNIGTSYTFTNVINKTYTFYVEHEESKLLNESGLSADLSNLKLAEDYTTSSLYAENASIMFRFIGWSISATAGGANKAYFIDTDGIYYLNNSNEKVYGFTSSETAQEGEYIFVNLYGTWDIPVSKVNVSFDPNLTYNGSLEALFTSVYGLIPKDTNDTNCVIKAAYGTNVKMNVPSIDAYEFYGWKLDGETEIKHTEINFTMGSNDVNIVLYYRFKVTILTQQPDLAVNANYIEAKVGQSTYKSENGIIEIWCLSGQEITLTAKTAYGYEWSYWMLDGTKVDALGQVCAIEATNTAEYTAVFVGKEVSLYITETYHAELQLQQATARVGDKIEISVVSVDYGYNLSGVSVNKSVNGVTKNTAGTKYYYTIQPADCEGALFIKAELAESDVAIKFVTNLANASDIYINGTRVVEGLPVKYKYNQVLSINISAKTRYQIGSIILGAEALPTEAFNLNLNQENGIKIVNEGENVINISINKLFWMDVKATFGGDGSEAAPYLIGDAYTLAYMAYVVNEGVGDYASKYYMITSNIDLNDRFWIPIGTERSPFDGVFILGDYIITNAHHAVEYGKLSWSEYCPGVFGYITTNAEIVLKQSTLPTILVIIAVVGFIVAVAIIITITIVRRKQKVKKLAVGLTVSNVRINNTLDSNQPPSDVIDEFSVNEQPFNMDDEVKKILEQARQKPNIKKDDEK